ncbi:NB-ARC domain-containing protein [Cellulomonas sp. P24]|uniref:NB-ARC domain-containing protein n=1 Tax=Cellulomonas sp. P24 TaxID=2885206 RepID=UPI00216ACB8D|nr:NB-ARC domain-containing protein [Cellulomonas sp. P24]MCR6491635.1 tetratricopeptide repeat protein [Cellulomonas sp. P24]
MDQTPNFLPTQRMLERVEIARSDSDTAYFFELLYLGEFTIKLITVELLAGLRDDRDRQRYALEHRLVRADGIGAWAEIVDEALTGPASQHFVPDARDSQTAIAMTFGPGDGSWQRRAVDHLNAACRYLEPTYGDTSALKVSLRNWIRDFVWLRNRTRGHGSPKPEMLSTLSPRLQESLDAVLNGSPTFSRSWVHLKRGLSGKYRVTRFGGDRSPFAHLAAEADHQLADGIYVAQGEPRRVQLLFTDADLTDFFVPNGAFRGDVFEAVSYVTDDRRSIPGASWLLPADAEPPSETAAYPGLEVVGESFTNMPPRRSGYISRPTLESELDSVLCDDRHPVITLHGRGGVGKTSMALEVLHRIAEVSEFSAIVWFSARDIDLLPDGPKVVRADVLSIDDIARDFARLLTGAKPKISDARRLITAALSGTSADGPYLFVFDNFETIRAQGELYAYLSNAVRLPNKVLITTRSRDFKADYPVEVGGMAREEYQLLVQDVAGRLGISSLLDEEYKERLYEESDGHPYITKVLLGEVAHAGRKVAFKPVVATKAAVLDALFDRSFASLSLAGKRVFLTLCSWRSLVPRIGLEAVLLRPGNERFDIDAAVAELAQASLIEEVWSEEDSSSFLSVPLAAAVFGKRKLVASPLKIAVEADIDLLHSFGAATAGEVAAGLGPRVDRLAKVVAQRIAEGANRDQELAVVQYIATAYPKAWLNVAQIEEDGGNLAEAAASVRRYLEARPDDESGWRKLAQLCRAAGDSLGEVSARIELAERASTDFYDLSMAAQRLNYLLSTKEVSLEADERLMAVGRLRLVIEARWREADATDLSRLAWLCMHDHDLEGARHWASVGLESEPDNEHCRRLVERLTSS